MKDNNADLGNQTIEGTSPPIDLEAEIVMPDGSSQPISMPPPDTEPDLDAQLNALLDGDDGANASSEPIILSGTAEPIFAPPPPVIETEPVAQTETEQNLDDQLNAMLNDDNADAAILMGDTVITPPSDEPQIIIPPADDPIIITPAAEEPVVSASTNDETVIVPTDGSAVLNNDEFVITPPPFEATPNDAQEQTDRSDIPTAAELDAQLEALLDNEKLKEQDIDAQLDALMDLPPDESSKESVEPTTPAVSDESAAQKSTHANTEAEEARHMMDEARRMMDEVRLAQEQIRLAQEQAELKAQLQSELKAQIQAELKAQEQAELKSQDAVQSDVKRNDDTSALDAAREMMRQAQLMMQQAQAAHQPQQQANITQGGTSKEAQAALEMIRQAQLMMQQAQQAQFQAQQTAQQAQFNAAMQAQTPTAMPITDPYAVKEVDRLKNELDGMRDLVNKLTFSIAQNNPAAAQQPAQARNDGDREQYRKLETELERMRREIIEKDLRDREKELERKQKEAENSVKDIRPEMIQMSDSRDVAPLASNPSVGGEFIPLANGVFYSIKDKQVYVMTPASNAAAARPTIEPKKPAAPKRKAAPARPAARRRPAPRRPGAPSSLRRRPTGRPRPHR